MKITSSLIDKLIRLRSGESLPSSALRGEWVEELLSDGVLISRSHGSRSSIIAASPETLEQSLRHTDERLGNLDKMKETLDTESTRSGQAAETGNSKLVTTRSCPGFPVNSYEPITCSLSGKELVVNPQEGTFIFITDWHYFAIPEDVTVVNIENMENFRLIRRQQALFPQPCQASVCCLCRAIRSHPTYGHGCRPSPTSTFTSATSTSPASISSLQNFKNTSAHAPLSSFRKT